MHSTSLLQAMNGERNFSPAECVRIERESGEELMRWDLRPKDWRAIWPELLKHKKAPPLPTDEKAKAE